jgi:hypothetical protein
MFDLKAAWARFSADFWRGYETARAKAPIDTPNPFAPLSEAEIKAMISAAMRAAFESGYDSGVQAERARIAAAWAVERDTVGRPTESHAPESATLH